MQNYSEVNKEIRRRMKEETKENWITDRCKEIIGSGIRRGNIKAAFGTEVISSITEGLDI